MVISILKLLSQIKIKYYFIHFNIKFIGNVNLHVTMDEGEITTLNVRVLHLPVVVILHYKL